MANHVEHLSAMNVLRMIKLFGWEKKMNEIIDEKRNKELTWIWKRQILELINGNLKYYLFSFIFWRIIHELHVSFLIPVVTMIATYTT